MGFEFDDAQNKKLCLMSPIGFDGIKIVDVRVEWSWRSRVRAGREVNHLVLLENRCKGVDVAERADPIHAARHPPNLGIGNPRS